MASRARTPARARIYRARLHVRIYRARARLYLTCRRSTTQAILHHVA